MSGKSTLIPLAIQKLKAPHQLGCAVLESATNLEKAGLGFKKMCLKRGIFSNAEFQRLVMKLTYQEEELKRKTLESLDPELGIKQVIVLVDRGITDGAVYCKDKLSDFDKILDRHGFTMKSALDRYDSIFHLDTVCFGREDIWNERAKKDNETRYETPSEAREKCDYTNVIHSPHENYYRFHNYDDSGKLISFDQKLNNVLLGLLHQIERNPNLTLA